MSLLGNLRINARFNIILSLCFIALLLTNAIDDYQRQQSLIIKDAVDNARILAKQIVQARDYMSSVVRDEPEHNYSLVPQVVSTQIAKRITADSKFYVRQVSLRYRNPENRPDEYEAKELQLFAHRAVKEKYEVISIRNEKVFRYMLPMFAEQSCLGCHGSYDEAPAFVRARFPQGHYSYNYKVGEIIGAVSVSIPMADLYRQIGSNLKRDLAYSSTFFFLLLLLMWTLLRRNIIAPIQRVSSTISEVTKTGNFAQSIPVAAHDEVGQLINAFNELMEELERKTVQSRESEDRYRKVVEMAQSAIVTFLADGKIVIANNAAEVLFGIPRHELLGESIFAFFDDGNDLRQEIGKYLRSGKGGVVGETVPRSFRDIKGRSKTLEMALSASQGDETVMFTAILREK